MDEGTTVLLRGAQMLAPCASASGDWLIYDRMPGHGDFGINLAQQQAKTEGVDLQSSKRGQAIDRLYRYTTRFVSTRG